MCGIAGIFGRNWRIEQAEAMLFAQRHRGPNDKGVYYDPALLCALAHNRLSIIDLSAAGRQPMTSHDGNYQIIFNGEIYNYLELRRELGSAFDFRTRTDTEVLLAGYQKWGAGVLDRLTGMFAFIVWDERKKEAFAARDRFGVKPLHYHQKADGTLFLASEIKAIHAAGISREPNRRVWADYFRYGLINHSAQTFWRNIFAVPAGHSLTWRDGQTKIRRWYDLAENISHDFDARADAAVREEYLEILKESVRLRFRSDVPVGINLSGGVDSSALLGLVHALEKPESEVAAFTFATGDERYDELPWVRQMLAQTGHPHIVATLKAAEVPSLALSVQSFQDEPFGGVPTLAYAKLFDAAAENGTIVLLDGNGLDEQWAGYDYYRNLSSKNQPSVVQGTADSPVRPECLTTEFGALAEPLNFPDVFPDKLRNAQLRDVYKTKIPRAMRYNDRVSMRASTELREPFLDHRLFELAFRQPAARKIENGVGKKMLREIVGKLIPANLAAAPKRPLQTPQREWLRGELKPWAESCVEDVIKNYGGVWFEGKAVRREWRRFCGGESDNSFYVWQWISLSLADRLSRINSAEINSGGREFEQRLRHPSRGIKQEISFGRTNERL